MAFQRALWHSGLTYQQICFNCHALVQYTDHNLDFRAWYPDGFVYCPKCREPLRHSETFAIDANGQRVYADPPKPGTSPLPPVTPLAGGPRRTPIPAAPVASSPVPDKLVPVAPTPPSGAVGNEIAFCSKCGRQYTKGANNFCYSCGNKLVD
jgi:predicted amidophosphoribosyltransferase